MLVWGVFTVLLVWFLITLNWGSKIGNFVEKIMNKWGKE